MRNLVLVPLFVGGARIYAQATETFPPWAQYGVLGVVIIGLVITRTIVPGWIYQEKATELVSARTEIKALTQQILDNQAVTLPALQSATNVVQQAMPLVQEALRRGHGGGV